MKTNYMDMGHWQELASASGLRLPNHQTPLTEGGLERWLRKCGIPLKAFLRWYGASHKGVLLARNSEWSMRAMAGLILEHKDDIMATVKVPARKGAANAPRRVA